MHEQFTGAMRPTLLMLSIAGALVLLIACANVANLLLVRAIARRREFAVRIALGASPGWIVRQTLGESFLLALLGAVVAVLVASYCTGFLGSVAVAVQPQLNGLQRHIADMLMGGELPLMLQPRVDWTVLGFSLAVAAVTTVLFGLVPALRACRADLLQDLKEGRGSSGLRPRLQSLLVAGQVGVTAVLLISAGLFLRSFSKVLAVDPGFDAQHTIAFSLATPGTRYPNPERVVHFVDDVETRLVGLPGVEAVGTTTNVPFRSQSVSAVGLATAPDREHDTLTFHDYVGGDLFRALSVPLQRGRVFTPADNMTGAQRVVILTEKLARDLFHEQDPIGQHVFWDRRTWTVVGLVQDVRMIGLDVAGNSHNIYAPSIQRPAPASVIVRTRESPAAILESIRRTVRAVDPDQPLSDLHPLAQDIGRSLDGTRTNLALVLAFAAVALALACIGIYGVLAFVVGQRERELGIRLALGAPKKGVLAMVLRDGLSLVLAGLAVGLLAAIAGGRLIASFLFGISAHDPVVFATVGALLTAAAAAACLLPARRATKVDPMIALRAE